MLNILYQHLRLVKFIITVLTEILDCKESILLNSYTNGRQKKLRQTFPVTEQVIFQKNNDFARSNILNI